VNPLIDFHIHSKYSKGNNSIIDIADHAQRNNMIVGIADQYSWHRYKLSKITRNLDSYIDTLNKVHEDYSGILRGIEIDTTSIHKYNLFEQHSDDFDFIFFEFVIDLAGNYSFDPKRRNRTLETLKKIAEFKELTGIISCLSRPDFSLVLDQQLVEDSLDIIEKHGIVIELNEKHGNYYNSIFIENVLARDIRICCGTSSSSLEEIAYFPLVNDFMNRFNILKSRLISLR